jgi:glycosyltransferase involved in cell wall biosynthesis
MANHPDLSVTVVIPCYNQGKYLVDAVQSVIRQTISTWEVVIVDDASTEDNIQQIVDGFHESRIRMIRHPKNLGLACARNTGIRASTSPCVLPLDADDYLDDRFLELVALTVLNDPRLDAAFADFQLFGEETEIWAFSGDLNSKQQLIAQAVPGAGTVFRKSLWERIGGYPESPSFRRGNEDWDFWLSAGELNAKVVRIPLPLYFYRRYKSSMSLELIENDNQTREAMIERHPVLFKKYHYANSFLAAGYYQAAIRAVEIHNVQKSLKLFRKALSLTVLPVMVKHFIGAFIRHKTGTVADSSSKLRGV